MTKDDTADLPGLFNDLPEKAPKEQIAKISLRNWREHLASIRSLDKRIEKLLDDAVKQTLAKGRKLTAADIGHVFQRHPEVRATLDEAMEKLNADLTATIEQGSKEAWLRANTAADEIVSAMAANNTQLATLLNDGQNKPQNDRALRAFRLREMQGMKLSDRVWKSTEGMKLDMERAVEVALAEGVPAQKLSQRVRELLREPHRLYRRVRDKDGNLKLSQAAQKYHPGTGVYRSSYKNAMRVARTEVNMAYQASDSERWKRSWWVRGIRISLSNNHTSLDSKGKPSPLFDICDTLAGDYPADFKFTGWHPQCRCYATAITCDYADIRDYYQRKRAGEDMTGYTPLGAITEPPEQFKRWLTDNSDRLAGAASRGTTPYFISENKSAVDKILGMSDNPFFATKVKVGDKEYLLKHLIAECRIEPTENGKIYVHPDHGKGELAENLDFARWRAEIFGEEVILLPNPQNVPSADSYNITRGVNEEYKRPTKPTLNAISQSVRYGKDQADYLIIETHPEMKVGETINALTDRISNRFIPPRCANLKEIRIKVGDYEAVYTREQICEPGFKIKPEDFRNASVSRSRGTSHATKEAGSITDTKLQNFFGLNKKTPQEIAVVRHARRKTPLEIADERHARRTAADEKTIRERWQKRQDAIYSIPNGLSETERENWIANMHEIARQTGVPIGKPMTYEQADKQSANPLWKPKKIYDKTKRKWEDNPAFDDKIDTPNRINCQTCAPAYALRRRGFDLYAGGNTPGSQNQYLARGHWSECWLNPDGTPATFHRTQDWLDKQRGKKMTAEYYRRFFDEVCKEPGVYNFNMGWSGDQGHVTVIQREEDGTLRYVEPQHDNYGTWRDIDYLCKNLQQIIPDSQKDRRGIMRVDNKMFNPKFLGIFRH